MNNAFILELFCIICFALVIFAVVKYIQTKYLPFNFKNCSIDITKRPEKTYCAAGVFDSFILKGPFLKLEFYTDFMLIKMLGKFVIVNYFEEITIEDSLLYSKFYFKKDNLKYCIMPYSKQAIEYLNTKINK